MKINKDLLMNLTRSTKKVGFKFQKHSPELLVIAGVTGIIASTVMACKATTKINGILDNAKNDMDLIKNVSEHPETLPEEYTEEDSKKDLTIVYLQTGIKVIKNYLPAVALGTLSLTCILSSHHILRKRNMALAAAYATIDKGFKGYRSRVVERYGEKIDKELRYDIKVKELATTVVNEKGKEKVVNETIAVSNLELDQYSDYARFFDNGNPYWEKDSEYNLMFLRQVERMMNDKLQLNGRVFLNDVYEALGIPRSKAGQIVGWTYDKDHPIGDNYIDFGIYDTHRPNSANADFVNGYERSIILDFNIDGDIWNMM